MRKNRCRVHLVAEKLCTKIPSHHMHRRKSLQLNVMDGFECKEYITGIAPLKDHTKILKKIVTKRIL